jgi:putative phage-type endonuclease
VSTNATPARAPRQRRHDRRKFLGGSEIAAVMGISPWQTPVELWKDKTGRAEPRAFDAAREGILRRGKRLEPIVRAMAIDKMRERGLQVELVAKNRRYYDREMPWLTSEIDFEVVLSGVAEIDGTEVRFSRELVTADCKTAAGFARRHWGQEDTDAMPLYYAAQFMQGLDLTGRDRCLCAALIGLDDVALYWVTRDDVTIGAMRQRAQSFWVDHVLADVPPDPIKYADIRELYPVDNGRTLEATEEIAAAAREHRSLGRQIKTLEAQRDALALEIGDYLQEFQTLTIDGKKACTLTGGESVRVDLAAMRRQHDGLVALFEERKPTRVLRHNTNFRG